MEKPKEDPILRKGESVETESRKRDLEECKKEKDCAYDVLNKDQAEYDKQILALSATFLGVSVAFVKDIVPLNVAVSLWSYDVAICLLFLCVCFVLGTYQYSIHGHFWLINYWETREKYLNPDIQQSTEIDERLDVLLSRLRRKGKWIRIANCISGILFAIAIFFLVLFVVINIHQSSNTSKEVSMAPSSGSEFNKLQNGGNVQRGAHLKIPTPAPQNQPNQVPAQPVQPQTGGTSNGRK